MKKSSRMAQSLNSNHREKGKIQLNDPQRNLGFVNTSKQDKLLSVSISAVQEENSSALFMDSSAVERDNEAQEDYHVPRKLSEDSSLGF